MTLTAPTPPTARRSIMRYAAAAVPLIWAPFVYLHPEDPPYAGTADGNAGMWLTVHFAQLLMAPFLVLALWPTLSRLVGAAATVAKVALTLWLAFFSAFDAIAGIATGRLSQQADHLHGAEGVAVGDAVTDMFENDPLVGGGFSALALLAQPLWLVVAIALTAALFHAGERPLTIVAAGLSTLFALHGGPIAALGLLALTVALATARLGRTSYPATDHQDLVVDERHRSSDTGA